MVIKAIIFDLFGVLVLPGYTTLFNKFPHLVQEINQLVSENDYGTLSRREFYESMAKLTNISVETVKSYYRNDYSKDKDAIDWVKELKKSDNYKLGMLSNVGHGWVEDFFSRQELAELFDEVVLSSDVGLAKPAPRIFSITAERLEVPPVECVMFDDKLSNVQGANAAGVNGILYKSLQQAKLDFAALLDKNNA